MSIIRQEKGSIEIAILLGVAVILVVAVLVIFVRNPKKVQLDQKKEADSSMTTPTANNKLALENAKRKNDATTLMAAIEEFSNNNSGKRPNAWQDGQLISDSPGMTPAAVSGLTMYPSIRGAEGEQSAVDADMLRFVIKAACGKDGKAVADTKRPTSYVVQYGIAQSDGSFKGVCLEG